ncbi:MAG: hypothetical protein JWP09_869 [Candidatus Taylorbacteria bacterium]|nr:hypothetical protein [Candidatus Taylorbacteria bacterium]
MYATFFIIPHSTRTSRALVCSMLLRDIQWFPAKDFRRSDRLLYRWQKHILPNNIFLTKVRSKISNQRLPQTPQALGDSWTFLRLNYQAPSVQRILLDISPTLFGYAVQRSADSSCSIRTQEALLYRIQFCSWSVSFWVKEQCCTCNKKGPSLEGPVFIVKIINNKNQTSRFLV